MNLANMISSEELLSKKNSIKKIFFFRICGTGMGACACLLKENGYEVEGADQNFYPPMSTYLESTGIPLHSLDKIDANFLSQYDLIIVGNSVPRLSDGARLIEDCGVQFTSFPNALGTLLLKDKKVIGVAGTHGKTTTTFFLTQMFEHLKVKAGYFVGGILNDRPPSTLGEDEYFVIESDEYDSAYFQKFSKFRLYELDKMILTSLEFDHADIYNSVEEIEAEFEAVMPKLDAIIADSTYKSIEKLQNKFKDRNWHLYNNKNGPLNICADKDHTSFQVVLDKQTYSFQTNIIGAHNIYNITSCIILLHLEGFSVSDIQHAVTNLSLVKRRQEKRGLYNGAIVIDDFAHHPRAISLTVDAIKTKYPEREIVTVFEPVSATARSNVFQNEFAKSLMSSDKVIIAKSPMATTAKNSNNLDCEKLIHDLKGHCKSALVIDNLSDLRDQIKQISNDKNLILVLSNRSCLGLWESDFVKELV